ncbi:MAG: hypothetical protein RBU45_14180 [Myxococcota bacterium]|jgi:hypothetical protein|nr:hypothetical protein [Myxococcota bacterium]
MTRLRRPLLLSLLLGLSSWGGLTGVAARVALAEPALAEPAPTEPTPDSSSPPPAPAGGLVGPDWLFVLTPTGGWLDNEITFKIKVPQGIGGDTEYQEQWITLRDQGYGLGLTAVGFYKHIALTNVFFAFPEVNESRLIGNITYLSGTYPTGTFANPYFGLGFVVVNTATNYEDFRYTQQDELYGEPAVGFAHFEQMRIDNTVIAPFPKLGLELELPIQHWSITPFYSLMVEDVETRARGISTDEDDEAGHVQVWYADDLDAGKPPVGTGQNPAVAVDVPAFDKDNPKLYVSNLVGTDFFLDFHYFLQLRGKVYYNLNHDLWTVRLIGSLLFNEWLGLSAYFEYTEKITVTNTYLMVGPAIVLAPEAFVEGLRARRRR